MAKIAGVDVLVKVNVSTTPTVVGGQSGATLNRSADTFEVTAKDSGGWNESLVGNRSWSVECDGFIIESDAAYAALETAFDAGTAVTVEIAMPSGDKYSGSALVTDLPLEFPGDDAATYKVTLTGTGALTKTPKAA